MHIKRFLLILVLILPLSVVRGQIKTATKIVEYRAEVFLDTSKFETHKRHVTLVLEEVKNLSLNLRIQDILSVFEVDVPMGLDNRSRQFKKRAKSYLLLRDGYYNDIKNRQSYIESNFNNGAYFIKSSLSKYDWQLKDETKIILGKTCYKATAIRNYLSGGKQLSYPVTAWYCPEIPMEGAPKDYYGLPGLVFELWEDNYIKYTIKELDLTPVLNSPIVMPEHIVITRQAYDQIVSEALSSLKMN